MDQAKDRPKLEAGEEDPVDPREYYELAMEMEEHHAIFYMMHKMGRPVFTNKTPTASVTFDREGGFIGFQFNPSFWNSLTRDEKKFVISHECLHVIFNHGLRSKNSSDRTVANIAMDLVVNHSLVNNFGFDRNKLPIAKDLYWVDTTFPKENISTKGTFEYYMTLLLERAVKVPANLKTVDDHQDFGEIIDGIKDQINEGLSYEEKQSLKEIIDGAERGSGRSTEAGSKWLVVNPSAKRKRKWETVIKKWSRKYDKPQDHDIEQWARLHRRLAFFNGSLILPSDMEEEKEVEGKIKVWFFQDTSGSCMSLAERFFKAARSLDPARFDIRMFCFDTGIYETTLASGELYGFGGTAFDIIEEYIQKYVGQGNKYPEAVFVITDGEGNSVDPAFPERWYWFLSGWQTSCIPPKCNIYRLCEYE